MADKRITELSPIVTISSGDVFPIVDISDNTTKKIDITQIKAQSPVQSVNSNIGVVVLTKTDIGLSNVDNTSDANKPVSTATQTALDGKVDENASITGATKTKITYDAKGLVTAGADATTADIAASTNKNYVTDAEATVIGNTSGTNSGNQTLANTSDATSHTTTLSATGGSVKLVEGSGITLTTTGTTADGIITIASTGGGSGTVTNVSALTLGTTGTDLSSSVANSTTTPVITLNVPTASAANRGALSSADWTTFNGKQDALVSGTNIKTINSSSILGSGNLVVTAVPSGVAGAIQYSNGSALASDATNFFWDIANFRAGFGTNSPTSRLHVKGSGATSATSSLNVMNSATTSSFFVRDDGNVGLGTTTPTDKLMIVGSTTGSITTSIRNTNAGGDSRLTLKNDLSGAVGVQVTGSTYFGAASSYFFTQGGLAAMGFSTDGDLAAGGSGIITFATGGYSASQERMRILANGNIAINVFSTYAGSARLQIDSTTQGFLPPRMTTVQKNAIATPVAGLVVYDTTLNKLCLFTSAWETITSI
jgi:hypothetical protein